MMESRLIYSTSSHLRSVADWNERIYCGVGDDMQEDTINKAVTEYFQEGVLFFVKNRKESGEIKRENIVETLRKELGENEIILWDVNFQKAIQFNKIGVMRVGFVQHEYNCECVGNNIPFGSCGYDFLKTCNIV